jgi:hypothetical protein
MSELSIGVLEVRRGARLKDLGRLGPVLQGTVASIGVRCGNPGCRCARGEKHVSNVLTRKVRGKTKSVYVPSGMLEDARKWAMEFRKAKRLLKEISDCSEKILKKFVSTERAKKRNLAAARRKDLSASSTPTR